MKTSEVRINDIAQIITGKTPPIVIKEYFGNKYPFITPSDIPTFRERRLREVERHLSDKGFSHQKKMLIPPNSPCFVAIGSTVGKMCLTNEDSFTNQQIHSLITQKGKADPFYLFYHLRYIYPWIKSIADARGSGKAIINKTDFGKIKINIPPLTIQKKIAAVLSAYDDLIENNKRRIAILEKMAEEIYREWFVRMRFPGHEKVKFHKGVPEGWDITKLGDILELAYGKALKEDDRIPGDYPVYGSSGIVGVHKNHLVNGPGIIVGRKGNVGSVHWSEKGFFPIDTVYYVISDFSFYFLFYLLQNLNFINNDAAVPGLNRKQAYSNKFYLPPQTLVAKFDKIIKEVFNYKNNLSQKNSNLTKSRNLLLSRLLSGKLSVENLNIKFPPGMEETDA